MPSTMNEFLERALDRNLDEMSMSSGDKKMQGYRQGSYMLSSVFSEFSQGYMRGLGMMMQNKESFKSKDYVKLRDTIATAYARMDSAISKHNEKLSQDAEVNKKM